MFLILGNLRVHHSKVVKAWTEERKDQIELFYLPSYSPQLNPEERLNAFRTGTSNLRLKTSSGRINSSIMAK